MKIWHKDLIDILPRKQLILQWRNCCAIAKEIQETGTVKGQAKEVINYPLSHFRAYAMLVANECGRRGYKMKLSSFWKYFPDMTPIPLVIPTHEERIFPKWHSNIYLMECLGELIGKRRHGTISEDDWIPFEIRYGSICKTDTVSMKRYSEKY